ncbi:hypothetical protein AJ80_05519 [Polytolypa hystricis UAMH7299]|uniref:Major facilitator superfamily (MFS) profile domain-containing protein n=1 Tax=Polytolypa hystricis (strain UAMH7299) TaxID=1447883 RepID=A0A2B7Y3T3_POLH7|nr:hypothetical protein AJ80_05519 [Polytolypa hystricis UAMH7299]
MPPEPDAVREPASTAASNDAGTVDDNSTTFETVQKLSKSAITLTIAPLCLSALLSSLDLTIVTPAIPAIVASFQSMEGYVWIGSAFILAHTAITPVWGSVADIWGRKPIMLIAQAVFLGGSLLCALAPHMDALIAGRAIQGLGASGMGTMVNVIICDMCSLRDRGLYLAITSMVWAMGSAVGPVLGGVFTTRLNWRWCFWINLPIGAFVFVVLLFFLDVPNPKTPVLAGIKAIDWTGSTLIVGGALMILLGVDFGDVTYAWSSATVICLIVFGAIVVGIFLVNEWKFAKNPVIPLRLFAPLSTLAAYVVFTCNFYVFIGLAYYLPLYSQAVLGADALASGLHLLPLIVSSSLSAAASGVFIQRTGKYLPVMYVAQTMLTLGVGLFISLKFEKSLTRLFIFEILTGVGVGLNIEAPILAAQATTTVRDTAAVIATMSFVRSIGTAISVVVGGVIFQNQMNVAGPRMVEQLGQELANRFDGKNASANVDLVGTLPVGQQDIIRRSYFGALRSVWIMYVAFAGASMVITLFVRGHHLSTETNQVVLGVDRGDRGARKPENDISGQEVELAGTQEDSPRQ